MEKNIYRLLNNVNTDFTEYGEFNLSSEEKELHKQKILQEVRTMQDRTGKKSGRKNTWKIMAGTAAACALVIGSLGAAYPVAAEGLFSNVFGQLIKSVQGEKYEKEETEMFTALGKKSVTAQDEVLRKKDKSHFTTTAKDQGVKISVSDIYCDGYILYYTATLETDNEDLMQSDGISSVSVDGRYFQELEIDGIDTSGYSSRDFSKAEDGSFIAVNQIDLMDMIGSNDPDTKAICENGTAVVNWTLRKLKGSLYDQWDDNGEYMETASVEGEWSFKFPVTIDWSANETYEINQEQNGFLVKNAVKTKAGLVVEMEIPDMDKDPYRNTDIGIKDAHGNWLQWLNQKTIPHEDGSATCYIMVLYDGQKDLNFQVTTRQENPEVLVDVGFQIP